MAIDCENDFAEDGNKEKERVYTEYKRLGLSTAPLNRCITIFHITAI